MTTKVAHVLNCSSHNSMTMLGTPTSSYLPNFRGHTSQGEAAAELDDFFSLVNSGCSPVIRQFLCTYYLPFCGQLASTGEIFRIRPCQSLCEMARSNCSEFLEQNSGITWPVFLNCSLDTFPCGEKSCFGPPAPCEPDTTTYQLTTSSVPMTFVVPDVSVSIIYLAYSLDMCLCRFFRVRIGFKSYIPYSLSW